MSAPGGGGGRSTSPVPPAAAAASANSTTTTSSQDDWRKSVPQSYRSEEVREVAKVLASLEPNTTASSKLMLAMRFEETIFQSSSSLSDYRKRLTKRLKKVQKSYKPPKEEGKTSDNTQKTAAEEAKKKEEEMEAHLRDLFGTKLLFICQHAAEAIQIMREKHGRDRAAFLKQHTDNAEQWAVEIGLPLPHPPPPGQPPRRRRIPREVGYLDRLKVHFEQRVDNIRSHVVKLTQPDLFIEETLVKLEDDMEEKTAGTLAVATLDALKCVQSTTTTSTTPNTNNTIETNDVETTKILLQKALTQIPTPPPKTRLTFATHQKAVKEAAISHISKLKHASNALISYMALDSKGKAEVYGCLKKSHNVAVDSLKILDEILGKLEREMEEEEAALAGLGGGEGKNADDVKKKGKIIKLEDAWNKVMEYKSNSEGDDINDDASTGSGSGGGATGTGMDAPPQPDAKRLKTTSSTTPSSSSHLPRIVLRSQVLLATPNRKPPSSLLSALKMKHAELITAKSGGCKFYSVKMKFGTVFEMVIFFVPLLVTIRALPASAATTTSSCSEGNEGNKDDKSSTTFRKTIANGGLPTYISPRRYLHSRHRRKRLSTPTTTPPTTSQLLPLSVLNVSGTSSTLGHVISQKLHYASSQATLVLRRIFAQEAGKCYVTGVRKSDFEIEISEATALLQFLQLARDTYLPGWEEVEGA